MTLFTQKNLFQQTIASKPKKLRSPITWFGGKGQLVNKLLQYVPPHKYYFEVFGGGASLLFAKEPAPFEVYNDIDEGLFNFFKVLRDPEKFEKFYFKVCLTPYSRKEYNFCRETWQDCEDEVERAYRWFIVARMSFGGHFGRSWGFAVSQIRRNMTGTVSKYLSIIEELPLIHQRVMTVQIECKHWKDLMLTYSGYKFDEAFYYLDPPYYPTTRRCGTYEYEMTKEDHEELINFLLENQDKYRIMLSGYDNELYQKLEKAGWKKVCWDVACRSVGKTRLTGICGKNATWSKNQRRIECIWMNYDLEKNF